jgi:hypothetical protein
MSDAAAIDFSVAIFCRQQERAEGARAARSGFPGSIFGKTARLIATLAVTK